MNEELFYVLAEAVDAYKAASQRGRNYSLLGYNAEKLVKEYPKYYGRHSDGKVRFIGKTADEILEEYCSELGYKPASQRWHQLVTTVIELSRKEGP
tara:strand:+ start:2924 stop:3211 length:288 start_codon:yes stop_codon:yes gene_type:complete